MPGRSGDSHPRCLIQQQREEYVLHCPGLPQSFFAEQVAQQAQEVAREDALKTGHRLGQIVDNAVVDMQF